MDNKTNDERTVYLRSLSVILISVAPRVPKHGIVPGAVWKQPIFSEMSNMSATSANLCSSSSILSSLIVKNVDT